MSVYSVMVLPALLDTSAVVSFMRPAYRTPLPIPTSDDEPGCTVKPSSCSVAATRPYCLLLSPGSGCVKTSTDCCVQCR
ncbi:hypothetical protein PISMIDRAFT_605662 [Pisolithus microcarpus 441]|uniref:Uncharacterized protein n=1 Tax=Pisolithus microcarpus 441 TaxID=765257 RepID=A0A0C9YT39_9AGAM|nr:hypothetical protein BKA83DRAFT_605662 [Pisolithus microcarpus]KIK28115.1 hypothetical protein PISMIDRAFT_605662 [Pisolithus microcarpus 441]